MCLCVFTSIQHSIKGHFSLLFLSGHYLFDYMMIPENNFVEQKLAEIKIIWEKIKQLSTLSMPSCPFICPHVWALSCSKFSLTCLRSLAPDLISFSFQLLVICAISYYRKSTLALFPHCLLCFLSISLISAFPSFLGYPPLHPNFFS